MFLYNSEIFAMVLFSRNFAVAKFRANKPSRNGKITLSFTDHALVANFYAHKYVLTLFKKTKFSRKFLNLQYVGLTLVLLNLVIYPLENRADPDQLASGEAI